MQDLILTQKQKYDGRPFMRSQSTTQRMSQEKYINMLHNRTSLTVAWDNLTTNNCTIKFMRNKN